MGYSAWGHKESDTTERLHFHFHFGNLAIKLLVSLQLTLCCEAFSIFWPSLPAWGILVPQPVIEPMTHALGSESVES